MSAPVFGNDPSVVSLPASGACATPMAHVGQENRLLAINPALQEWLGQATHSWLGEHLSMLDAKPPQVCEAVARALAQQRRVWLREARLRTAIGDRGADLALTPLDSQSLLLEVLPPARSDVLAGVRLSESLRGFAHEVRGPLTGVRGAAQLLQRRIDAPELLELTDLIVGEVDRLAELSNRLLQARTKPRLLRANIHEIIERVAALASAGANALRIHRDYDPSLPWPLIDADRVQQALLNLSQNAIEAGAQELQLRTRAVHGARSGAQVIRLALRIECIDDGHGVPSALADTLFEPLVSGRAHGSGLGLALAREIAREHGGELSHARRGSTTVFTLLLPVNG